MPAKKKPSPKPAKAAGIRAWHLKLGTRQAHERFVCGGHLLYWTGSEIRSVDATTGAEVGKAKADLGAPWADGDDVWIPTSKGFEVRTPALAVSRTVAVPLPKPPSGSVQFRGAAARVHGDVAYRVARSNAVTNVGGEARQEYFLHAYDIAKQQQRFLTSLANTAYPQVQGRSGRDSFAVEFRTDDGFDVVHGSTTDGVIGGTTRVAQSHLVVVGGLVFQQGIGEPVRVLAKDGWKSLGCTGEVRQLGEHIYCIGHRELVRLDGKRAVAARTPIATPPFADEAFRRPPTSACVAGKHLVVVERRDPIAAAIETTAGYRWLLRDPVTLAGRGQEGAFDELPWLSLVGAHEGLIVAHGNGGFVGLRLPV